MLIASPEAMEAFGRRLGALATALPVALDGDLGAGKSVLARGVARGLGITRRIPSPTFIICAEYTEGRIPLYHMDLYRLGAVDELENLGFDECIDSGALCLIEWAGRFPELDLGDHLRIAITIRPGDERHLQLTASGPRSRALERALGL